jgi:hypothetical protein
MTFHTVADKSVLSNIVVLWLAFLLRVLMSQVRLPIRVPATLTEIFSGFKHNLQTNAGIEPLDGPRPLSFTSFEVYNHPTIDSMKVC